MYDLALDTGSGPAVVRVGLPPASLLKFPPEDLPSTVPAPQLDEPTWYQPFNISTTLYTQLLDVRIPITIACVYAFTVVIANRVNKSRGYKPFAFSQSRAFKLFVILHNISLAIYSLWTFAGMVRAFRTIWPSWEENGIVGIVDALCKCNGPRGYGNAATYDTTVNRWSIQSPDYKLAEGGVPDPTDVGRLWNQGLAFLGWIFYLSKFYEVLDTAIILAKGKKSSTLQTYHHAGAMMCMWAGIRYVAPPIWIFTLVNSFIHALMYTYYTLTTLSIRVPTIFKQSLTTMQITQFVVGSAMAASYLFVYYTLPPVRTVPTSSAAAGAATTTATTGLAWLKQVAFRAAGAEGIAENVGHAGNHLGAFRGVVRAGHMVSCIDTSGQGFAIYLNVAYLLPLTYLFARFFVRSYLYRKEPSQAPHIHTAEKAGLEALKRVTREIQKAAEMSGETSETTEDEEVAEQTNRTVQSLQTTAENSPIRTRSSAAKKARTAEDKSEQGFSTVLAGKGAKKATKEETQAPGATSEVKTSNPYGVLGNTD
ncbi:elongation of very long chain fatty acids protein [Aspergillus lucknowensis]|uniref:Elongation of fatty acids protein n=1 Tax=Aspergillus lucknowensis TaxID=176173 RepID=A0ABR4M5C8_9EURO